MRRVLADLFRVAHAMTCDHGRETVVRTGRPRKRGSPRPSLGPTPQAGFPPADRVALTGEVSGGNPSGVVPRLNRRPYGRGHGDQAHGDSGGDGRGVSNIGSGLFRRHPWDDRTRTAAQGRTRCAVGRNAIARRTAGGTGVSLPLMARQRISLSSKSSMRSYASKSIFIDRSAP